MGEVLGDINAVANADDSDTNDGELRPQNVSAMRWRVHQAAFGGIGIAIVSDVLAADVETYAGRDDAVTHVGLFGKLVGQTLVFHHLFGMLPRDFGKAVVDFQRG